MCAGALKQIVQGVAGSTEDAAGAAEATSMLAILGPSGAGACPPAQYSTSTFGPCFGRGAGAPRARHATAAGAGWLAHVGILFYYILILFLQERVRC